MLNTEVGKSKCSSRVDNVGRDTPDSLKKKEYSVFAENEVEEKASICFLCYIY